MPDIRKIFTRNLQDSEATNSIAGNQFLQLRTSVPKQNPKAGGAEDVAIITVSSAASQSKYIIMANFIFKFTRKASLN